METEINLDFDAFLAEVGAVRMRYFSNQTESGEIHQFLTSSLFPTIFHLNPHSI